jgi:paraquat-inducible protein B
MSKPNSIFTSIQRAKFIIGLILLTIIAACGDRGITVTTEFRNAQGVKEGSKVYFEETNVGEVIAIDENESGVLVTLAINREASATIDSGAGVVVNRIKPGAPLEIYASATNDNLGLKEGQKLHGINSMIELVAWSLGDALQAGTGELAGYVDSFQDYIQGQQFEEDRARVEAGVKEMALVASEAMKSVEQDLAAAMSEVSVSEEELAEAILELGDELSPIAEEMAKSGTDLMFELDRFTKGLEGATLEEQASGQKLIESLIETIEKLNNAAERGVQNSGDNGQE